jgi:hypothetical protein
MISGELRSGLREVLDASDRGEMMDFFCPCGGEHRNLPSAFFLEFGNPTCPKCGQPVALSGVNNPGGRIASKGREQETA